MVFINGTEVGSKSFGLMGLTIGGGRPNGVPDEQAFSVLKVALDEFGVNFWNGGEFYGPPTNNSLTLLAKYFKKYPDDASRVFLSVKGSMKITPPSVPGGLPDISPDGTPEGVRRSVENCIRMLEGTKKIDIYECARVDPNVPIEETIQALAELVKEGKIGGIALSEPSANSIRRAHKIHPIAAVEIELSLWSLEPFQNGIISACAELGIPILAYAPLGKGMLTGQIKSPDDLPEGDFRRAFPRFQKDAFKSNLELVDALTEFAKRKGCTPAQLAVSWVQAQSGRDGNPVILPLPGASSESRVRDNFTEVEWTGEELKEIDGILAKFKVVGGRYPAAAERQLNV